MPEPLPPRPARATQRPRLSAAQAAIAGALAILAAACGGGSDAGEGAPDPTPTASVAAAEPTAQSTAQAAQPSAITAPGGEPRVAGPGDTVKVHYHGTLDSGEVFDSSLQRAPITFTVGSGQIIAGFNAAVTGLAVGDSVTVRLEPDQAYGERDPTAVLSLAREGAPEGLAVGDRLQLDNGLVVTVIGLSETEIHLDVNHPLAGMALTFEIELVSIE